MENGMRFGNVRSTVGWGRSWSPHFFRRGLLLILCALLTALFLAPTAASATALPGKITENTTLTAAGSPYTGSSVTIESGVTVNAEPGTELKVGELVVKGTLKAEGTAEKPILFTSVSDSAPGQWGGIKLESGSGGSVIDHAEVRYAGSGSNNPTIKISGGVSPTITNSTIRKGSYIGIMVEGGGSPVIAYNSVLNNGNNGIYYSAGSGTGTLNIHDNLIEGNTSHGIFVGTTSSIVATSLGGNTIKNNGTLGSDSAVYFSGGDLPPDIDENTLSGNKSNYIGLSGTVSQSTTWTDHGYPFVAENGTVTVAAGTTLTIGPGMTLKGIGPTVKGTLKAEGTAEKPILFTSVSDSAPGQWGGIKLESGSGGSVIDHAEVRYAGSGSNNPTIKISGGVSPTITNSTIRKGSYIGIMVEGGGSPVIAYNSVLNNGNNGIYYSAGSGTGTLNIHDNLIEGNTSHGIFVGTTSSIVATSLGGNTIKNNGTLGSDSAVYFSGGDLPPDIDENTLSGNKSNYIGLSGTVSQSTTWTDHGYPFVAENGTVTVAAGTTLTIGPGMTLKGIGPTVKGTLKAEGTAEKPILFTSVSDSAPGQWGGIKLESGSGGSVIDHAEVRYAGSGSNNPTIKISGGVSPTITNSTIRKGSYIGIMVEGGGSPVIAYNSVLNNGNNGIYYSAGSGTGTLNIHDNLIEGNTSHGIFVGTTSSIVATSLGGNTIKNNGTLGSDSAVYFSGGDLPPDIDENTLSGNKSNYIGLSGTVSQSTTWTDHGYPFVAENGTVTVAAGTTLTIGPGMTLKGIGPTVKGTLKAEGTAEKPILFTSVSDSAPGQWGGIKLESGSGGSVIDHAEVRYAGSGTEAFAIKVAGVSPTITHSAIRNNSKGGIKVTSSGKPTIQWTSFTGNSSFGVSYEGTGTLQAPHNYWGCASGPAPAGCGNSISGSVEWKPQAEEDTAPGHCQGKETQCGVGADPVSLATGYLAYSHRDLLLTSKSSVPLEFTRNYNSSDHSDGGLGAGWSQSGLASATELENGDVLIRRQDGRQDVFSHDRSCLRASIGGH